MGPCWQSLVDSLTFVIASRLPVLGESISKAEVTANKMNPTKAWEPSIAEPI